MRPTRAPNRASATTTDQPAEAVKMAAAVAVAVNVPSEVKAALNAQTAKSALTNPRLAKASAQKAVPTAKVVASVLSVNAKNLAWTTTQPMTRLSHRLNRTTTPRLTDPLAKAVNAPMVDADAVAVVNVRHKHLPTRRAPVQKKQFMPLTKRQPRLQTTAWKTVKPRLPKASATTNVANAVAVNAPVANAKHATVNLTKTVQMTSDIHR